jgi:hypothetical protein
MLLISDYGQKKNSIMLRKMTTCAIENFIFSQIGKIGLELSILVKQR